MSSRGERRRKRRSGFDDSPPPGRQMPFGRTTRIAFGFLIAGIVTVAIVALIASSLGGGDSADTVANTGAATATTSTGPTAQAADQADLETLARRSINVLPAGQWPSLYNDFTLEFRERCDLPAFTQGGVDSGAALGANLQRLEFKELKELSVTGDKASGTIVGGYRGTDESNYDIQASFAKEEGSWKIAPAPDTAGCSAFNQLRT